MGDTSSAFDVEEQRIRINRSIAETETFVAEQHKLLAGAYKLDRDAEQGCVGKPTEPCSASRKNEAGSCGCTHTILLGFAPVILTASAMTAGAALFGAGAAFFKLFGH